MHDVNALPNPIEQSPTTARGCRFCGRALVHVFVDLGMSPLCERILAADELDRMEPFYPLRVYVCDGCRLVQLGEYVRPESIFREYAYFSSYSSSWVEHARRYAETMIARLGLGPKSRVVEVASNDGYLLQHFAARGVPVLGIDPAENVAQAARARGVPTIARFFGREAAAELRDQGIRADLLVANNVLAHVPDLNGFVAGLKTLLAADGTLTLEFPHLQRLIEGNQFDTIYHEHFSYFSLQTAIGVLSAHGLAVFDVDELATHGGSLRLYVRHAGSGESSPRVEAVLRREQAAGYERLETYQLFHRRVEATRWKLLEFLISARRAGKQIVGYGAPGKGNTLLNYCGVRSDLIEYVVDRNPYKHGKYLPGTHIPIFPPERIHQTQPDVIVILPWNLKDEIARQLAFVRGWGAELVVPIPEVAVVPIPNEAES